jgi:hypothetical protein
MAFRTLRLALYDRVLSTTGGRVPAMLDVSETALEIGETGTSAPHVSRLVAAALVLLFLAGVRQEIARFRQM